MYYRHRYWHHHYGRRCRHHITSSTSILSYSSPLYHDLLQLSFCHHWHDHNDHHIQYYYWIFANLMRFWWAPIMDRSYHHVRVNDHPEEVKHWHPTLTHFFSLRLLDYVVRLLWDFCFDMCLYYKTRVSNYCVCQELTTTTVIS